jgi:uncharacterized protein
VGWLLRELSVTEQRYQAVLALGLAARMGADRTWWTLALDLTVCTLVIAFAHVWLRRFPKGPLESLWAWAYQLPQRSRLAEL